MAGDNSNLILSIGYRLSSSPLTNVPGMNHQCLCEASKFYEEIFNNYALHHLKMTKYNE